MEHSTQHKSGLAGFEETFCAIHGMSIILKRADAMGCNPTRGFHELNSVPIAAPRVECQPEGGKQSRAFENGS
jgi:hypothetical protein